MNITETIKVNIDKMTKSEKRIAAYFLGNPNIFAFETLDDTALKIDTSTTSVIRFCRKVGFSGYKDFQDAVRESIRGNLTLPDKFNRTIKNGDSELLRTVRNAESCIEKTFDEISEKSINEAVKAIVEANRVFCFGLRESFALAHYAYTRFLTVRSNVFMLSAGQTGEIESILGMGTGDVCIFFLFHRYTKPAPEILELLLKQGVTVILITSPPWDELCTDGTILLPCYVDINGIKNSSVAPICLTDHLCNSAVAASGTETLEYMKRSEELFGKFTFGEL